MFELDPSNLDAIVQPYVQQYLNLYSQQYGTPQAAGSTSNAPAKGQDILSDTAPAFNTTVTNYSSPNTYNSAATTASTNHSNSYNSSGVGTDVFGNPMPSASPKPAAMNTPTPTVAGPSPAMTPYQDDAFPSPIAPATSFPQPSQPPTAPKVNSYSSYMQNYGDLMALFNKPKGERGMFNNFAPGDLEGAGMYHFQNFGRNEGRVNPITGVDPNAPANSSPSTTPAPAGPTALEKKTNALNQATSRAKTAVAGRGLKWEDYDDLFNSHYNDIFNSIPDSDTSPEAWFDPNLANTLLGGEETRQRNSYIQQARGLDKSIDPHALDETINSILGNAKTSGQKFLDAGLKRGQFNQAGYDAGLNTMNQKAEAARAKLLGYAADIGSKYDMRLSDIENQALQAASGYNLGGQMDFSPYESQLSNILNLYSTAGAGELYNLVGDAPLIDLADLRQSVGMGQGATNMNNLDILDALSRRKKANAVGRGLGTQGAF